MTVGDRLPTATIALVGVCPSEDAEALLRHLLGASRRGA